MLKWRHRNPQWSPERLTAEDLKIGKILFNFRLMDAEKNKNVAATRVSRLELHIGKPPVFTKLYSAPTKR